MKNLVTRRGWLRITGVGAVGGLLARVKPAEAAGRGWPLPEQIQQLLVSQADSPELILAKLKLGNDRYVRGDLIPHELGFDQGLEVDPVVGQRPAAMILSCADSRAVPELIFDQPRARLFVCRIAGNFAPDEIVGSLEYGVEPLGAKLLIVLGHSDCGAVRSTIRFLREGTSPFSAAQLASKIPTILQALSPAVEDTLAQFPAGTPTDALVRPATEEIARQVASELRGTTPILSPRLENAVFAAYYDIATGAVSFL